ncbi:hypothetical protein [Hymenobacter sp. UYCo722]|uniref:DUF6985 domain-containing protein n=1 Tax=Hymenobacter sp. UYCo722 TaxID=3156335 RepID=UPI0033946A4A
MMNTLESQVVGILIRDSHFDDLWVTREPVAVPYFDNALVTVTFDGVAEELPDCLREADAALRNFLQLSPADRLAATAVVLANYQEMLDAADIEPLDLPEPSAIWQHVQPRNLVVTEETEGAERDFYIQIEGECDWEEEHGIALVFRQGRMLTRLSQYDGHLTEAHAYGRADIADPLMAQFYAAFGRPGN